MKDVTQIHSFYCQWFLVQVCCSYALLLLLMITRENEKSGFVIKKRKILNLTNNWMISFRLSQCRNGIQSLNLRVVTKNMNICICEMSQTV
jgi:hypothetical protein